MIIGLHGFARVGKDTVADLIIEESSGVCEKVGFADVLKLSAARAFGALRSPDDVGVDAVRRWADRLKTRLTIQIVDDEGNLHHEVSGRQFLQRYGTEAHRDIFGDDFWVDALELQRPGVDFLLVTDVRFPNEAAAIHKAGGEVWKVVRDVETVESHVTERSLPGGCIDREIENYGTIDDLREKVKVALGHNEVGRV